jgi:ABC-type antimicrobial peptide transport system permease subunit
MAPGRVPDRHLLSTTLKRHLPVTGVAVESVAATLGPWLEMPRLLATLFGIVASVATMLIASALLAVVRFEVLRRRRELVTRAALGASAHKVRAAAASFLMWPVIAGVTAGVIVSAWLGQLWSASVLGVRLDPSAYVVAAMIVAVVALVAVLTATAPVVGARNLSRIALRDL